MNTLLFCADLMTSSQIEGAARHAGATVHVVSAVDSALLLLEEREGDMNLILFDLSSPAVQPASLVPQFKSLAPNASIIAFGPHVHTEKLSAAQAAGCERVLSRGQIMSQLETLFSD